MAIVRKIVDATIVIDNDVIAYVPNTLVYTEGGGEQKIRIQTGGGGSVQQILSDDVTKRYSIVKFSVEPTAENLALMRSIKFDQTGHGITITSPTFSRTITGAILTKDYEVKFGTDDTIEVEFMGNASV